MRRNTLLRACLAGAAALLAAAGLFAACGDDDDSAGPTGTPRPTRAPGETTIVDFASDEPLLKLHGAGAGDLASDIPALATGDFNGDGIDDLAVGARFADPGEGLTDAGEAYIIFGSPGLRGEADLRGDADVVIRGADDGDNLGFALTAGDFNGDGVDDLAIGAPFAEGLERRELTPGIVYIIYGGDGLGGTLDMAAGDADVVIAGNTPSGFFGDSLAAGDVTGDGADDLVVGSTFARRADNSQTGAVYVFDGSADWPARMTVEGGDYAAVIFGENDLDELGDTVTVGDINGDGVQDVIATAEAADGSDDERTVAGEVIIVFGGEDLAGEIVAGGDGTGTRIFGAEQNDTLGFELAAGDLDGDGFDDLVMTARLAGGPRNSLGSAGEAYVLYGSSSLPKEIDLAEESGRLSGYHAPDAADLMGGALIIPAEDAAGQLLLGAAFGDGPGNSRSGAGEVYVIEPNRLAAGLTGADEAAHTVIYGASEGDALGTSFRVLDIDGNGTLELALVAAGADPDGNRPGFGIVYVIASP